MSDEVRSDETMSEVKVVAFDCDGVLVDIISSWRVLHDHFGTDSGEMLDRFIKGEITDEEFMEDDIHRWKEIQPKILREDMIRTYSGIKLMPGARDLVEALQARGVYVVIISAGVDLFVGAIAQMLKVDDWASNGFLFDENELLQDKGVVRVSAHHKGEMIEKICKIRGIKPSDVVSVGDSSTDLSMMIPNSRFIGFCPSRRSATVAFENAGVPIVETKDCRELWQHMFLGESFPAKGRE
jgi:phosphoserine phosphatase